MLCFFVFCTFEMSQKITQTKKVNWLINKYYKWHLKFVKFLHTSLFFSFSLKKTRHRWCPIWKQSPCPPASCCWQLKPCPLTQAPPTSRTNWQLLLGELSVCPPWTRSAVFAHCIFLNCFELPFSPDFTIALLHPQGSDRQHQPAYHHVHSAGSRSEGVWQCTQRAGGNNYHSTIHHLLPVLEFYRVFLFLSAWI